jgi:hypothetical protein
MTTPYAKILVSVNGAGPASGGIEVPSEATIAFTAESTVGWLRARWEIVDYPEGFTAPDGWSTDDDGTIFYLGFDPPSFDLPVAAVRWGKWYPRLILNEQMDNDQVVLDEGRLIDETTMLSMLSPGGLRDICAREQQHFTTVGTRIKSWLRALQQNLRVLEGGGGGGGGDAVIFDGGVTAQNLRTNRAASQPTINTEKNGIVNLSSDSTEDPSRGCSGAYSTISGGDQHSIGEEYCTIAGGLHNTIVGEVTGYGTIGGGQNNLCNGASYGTIAGGKDNVCGGHLGAIGGGSENLISALAGRSFIPGGFRAQTYIPGQSAYACGSFVYQGDCQSCSLIVRGASVEGAPVELRGGTGDDRLSLGTGTARAFSVRATCVARDVAGAAVAHWVNHLLVHQDAGVVVIDDDNATLVKPMATGWTIAYSASGEGVEATFTGAIGLTVRAAVTFDWTEIGTDS